MSVSSSPVAASEPLARYEPPRPAATTDAQAPNAWPLWQKVLFRFFFVYLVLQIAPWNWFRLIPGTSFVFRYYYQALSWAVQAMPVSPGK